MADIVASSVVQEGVSRVSSYISAKLDEKASRGQIMARLEWALSRLQFALERTAEWPTAYYYASLIRQRMTLKKVHKEGTDLLEKLKLQSVEGGEEEIHQWVTAGSSFLRWISRARNLPILSLVGSSKEEISNSSVLVQKFEWYADCADKFVSDVESGCPLRHPAFGYPFERQLLEGKTLEYHVVKGSQSHNIHMWPICSEGRGIEVTLYYSYTDYSQIPVKDFFLVVTLRLSQGTSIVGTAVRCVRFVTESLKLSTSPFKCVMERAMGEVTLLSSLRRDISHSYAPPPFDLNQESFVYLNTLLRPDPICCAKNVVSSELSHGVPEPVVSIAFGCSTSAPEYMLHSSSDEAVGPNASILHLSFSFQPHHSSAGPQRIVTLSEGKEKHLNGSIMQLMEDLLRSRARDFLEARHPEPARYSVRWISPHGKAYIYLKKSRPVTACLKQRAVPRPHGRAAKRTKR